MQLYGMSVSLYSSFTMTSISTLRSCSGAGSVESAGPTHNCPISCRLTAVCALKKALKHGQATLFDTLNTYTLADLVYTKPDMVRLLFDKVA